MKTWFKGGLIGLGYGVIASITNYILFSPNNSAFVDSSLLLIILNIFSTWPLLVGLLPFVLFWYLGVLTKSSVLLAVAFFVQDNRNIFGTIGLMLIGAVIGLIIDKIKNKIILLVIEKYKYTSIFRPLTKQKETRIYNSRVMPGRGVSFLKADF